MYEHDHLGIKEKGYGEDY
ncbi:hypothetical protein AYI70_g8195, partial [Smittium culicis]